MRALEELLGAVRDPRSRQHLQEATRAYNAGAFKSAIVSLWVAVAVDLVAKIRQLSDQGEPAAVTFVEGLDRAIATGNRQALMGIESKLLDQCRDDYEFIDARDHVALTRLREDRHVCAHPAFVSTEEVFEPTAELVRSHIATAVDAVLQHGPTAGRKAIERFGAEVRGVSWMDDTAELGAYLRERYLDRGKHALRINLAKVIVKGCITPPPEATFVVWSRHSQAAVALDSVAPDLFAEAVESVIGRAEAGTGLGDMSLIWFIGALGDLGPAWQVVPETSVPRFVSVVRTSDVNLLIGWRVLSASTAAPAVDEAIAGRLSALTDEQLAQVIAGRPARKLLQVAMDRLADTWSWRVAESRMLTLVLPLARHIGVAELRSLLQILQETDNVRMASGMPQLLDQLYEATRSAPGATGVWEEIVTYLEGNGREGNIEDWYAYPQLRSHVRGQTP